MGYIVPSMFISNLCDAVMNVATIILIVCAAAFVLTCIIDIFMVMITGKKGIFFKPKVITRNQISELEVVDNSANENVEYVCDYCGTRLDKNDKYCSSCGSKRHKKIKND